MFISDEVNSTDISINEDDTQMPLIAIVGASLPIGTVSEVVLIWWFIRKENKKPRDNLFIVEQAWMEETVITEFPILRVNVHNYM